MTMAEKYPQGLNSMIATFNKVVYDIFNSDEVDRVAKYATKAERDALAELKAKLKGVGVENIYIWVILNALKKCPIMLTEIIAMMVTLNDKIMTAQELEAFYNKGEQE